MFKRFHVFSTLTLAVALGLSFCTVQNIQNVQATEQQPVDIPSSYDLRDHNLVTPAKQQAPWSSCWAFGATSALESNALVNGLVKEPDFSEHFLIWFGMQPLSRARAKLEPSALLDFEAHSQEGEGTQLIDGDNITPFEVGALDWTAGAALTSGVGIQSEEDFPYANSASQYVNTYRGATLIESWATPDGDWSLNQDDVLKSSAFRVTSHEMYPSPIVVTSNEDDSIRTYKTYSKENEHLIKRKLMQKGALVLNYAADTIDPNARKNSNVFNYTTWSQYRDEVTRADHSAAIIGWDDSYPKENFANGATAQGISGLPPEDGAWIVKNNWGRVDGGKGNTYPWGVDGTGVFYLSYYDRSIESILSFDLQKADPASATCLQYDFVGMNSFGFGPMIYDASNAGPYDPGVRVANVFQAPYNMEISEIAFGNHLDDAGVSCEMYLLDDRQDPESGFQLAKTETKADFPGYHTFKLQEPVEVAKGESFSIILQLKGKLDGETYFELPVEFGYTEPFYDEHRTEDATSNMIEDNSDSKVLITTKINPGESFYDEGAGWQDNLLLNAKSDFTQEHTTAGNNLIKAFGQAIDHQPKALEDYQNEQFIGLVGVGVLLTFGGAALVVVVKHRYAQKHRKTDVKDV